MTISQQLNEQRTNLVERKQSILNSPLPLSTCEQEWILSNPNPDTSILEGVDLLRWHVHMEQLRRLYL